MQQQQTNLFPEERPQSRRGNKVEKQMRQSTGVNVEGMHRKCTGGASRADAD
jgi:hypothetical protein